MNQSEFEANACNRRQARENACERGTIGFGFDSHWLKKWREFCEPITERSKAKPKQIPKTAVLYSNQVSIISQPVPSLPQACVSQPSLWHWSFA